MLPDVSARSCFTKFVIIPFAPIPLEPTPFPLRIPVSVDDVDDADDEDDAEDSDEDPFPFTAAGFDWAASAVVVTSSHEFDDDDDAEDETDKSSPFGARGRAVGSDCMSRLARDTPGSGSVGAFAPPLTANVTADQRPVGIW